MQINSDISYEYTDMNFEAIILDFPTEQSRWGLCFLEMETTPAGLFIRYQILQGLAVVAHPQIVRYILHL